PPGSRYRGSLEKCGKPLAAVDVAALGVHTKLARAHILNHTLTQRGDSFGCHRQLLSWMRLLALPSSRQDASPATYKSLPGDNAGPVGQQPIAQRFSGVLGMF